MAHTPKRLVIQAVRRINEVFASEYGCDDMARLIDWSSDGDGYAIAVDAIDAIDVSHNATVHGALPKGTFLEPINSASLRLVIA